jgi:zinc protease
LSALPVFLERDASLPLLHVSLSAASGASHDPPGFEGLTRLSARLMRRTAGGRRPFENEAHLDRLGAALGVEVSHSSVSISGSCLSRSIAELCVFLEDMLEAGLDSAELERLKRESIAEITELLDSDEQLAQHWFSRGLFGQHAYGRGLLGSERSLQAIGVADVRECLHRHFEPGNVILGLAGDADSLLATTLAQRLGQGLKGSTVADVCPEPARGLRGRRLLYVDKPERSQNQIVMGCLGTHPRDPDHLAMVVGNTIFGGTFSARLTQEVRSRRGWSYGAYSTLSFERQRQAWGLWTFPGATDAAACVRLELDMVAEFVERGVTSAELDWAIRYLIQSHAFTEDTASKRVGLLLEQRLWGLPEGYFKEFKEKVAGITLGEVNQAIARRVDLDHWLISVVGTYADNGAQIEEAIGELGEKRVVAYDAP